MNAAPVTYPCRGSIYFLAVLGGIDGAVKLLHEPDSVPQVFPTLDACRTAFRAVEQPCAVYRSRDIWYAQRELMCDDFKPHRFPAVATLNTEEQDRLRTAMVACCA